MSIGTKLALIARELNIRFTLNDNEVPYEEVFADKGLLPAIMRRADQLSSFCLGYGLGITFKDVSDARLGMELVLDDEIPNALRLLCAVEIIYELIETASDRQRVPLDDLMYD
jgi:intracellular multiplication protein IcmS